MSLQLETLGRTELEAPREGVDLTGERSPLVHDSHPTYLGFRAFTLVPRERSLLRAGFPVAIGGRAFDLLLVLVRSRGAVVSKDEITRFVWPNLTVEESNLRFQMATLRKILGQDADLIKTVAGRGYLFAAEADHKPKEPAVAAMYPRPTSDPIPPQVVQKACQDRHFADDAGQDYHEALDGFLRSARVLVGAYGSIEALLGALTLRTRLVAEPTRTIAYHR